MWGQNLRYWKIDPFSLNILYEKIIITRPLIDIMTTEVKLFANLLSNKKQFRDAMQVLGSLLPWFGQYDFPTHDDAITGSLDEKDFYY